MSEVGGARCNPISGSGAFFGRPTPSTFHLCSLFPLDSLISWPFYHSLAPSRALITKPPSTARPLLILVTMFSVILPGRLPLASPTQVDETHLVFPLSSPSTISHVVVTMTGVQPFPPGYSATVHLLWPQPSSSTSTTPEWKLLGCIRNTKPSAIFKVTPPTSLPPTEAEATLGISIEPDTLVDQQIATLQTSTALVPAKTATTASASDTALALAPKIAKNAFSYLSSFAPDSAPQTVPLLQKWLEQLERKLRSQGPGFLDKQE